MYLNCGFVLGTCASGIAPLYLSLISCNGLAGKRVWTKWPERFNLSEPPLCISLLSALVLNLEKLNPLAFLKPCCWTYRNHWTTAGILLLSRMKVQVLRVVMSESSAFSKLLIWHCVTPVFLPKLHWGLGRPELAVSQRNGPSSANCISAVKTRGDLSAVNVGFCLKKWCSHW